MSKNSYTEKQIEAANLLRSITSDKDSMDAIDEVVDMIGEAEKRPVQPNGEREGVDLIKLRLLDEPDWRKRVALAALLISRSLE